MEYSMKGNQIPSKILDVKVKKISHRKAKMEMGAGEQDVTQKGHWRTLKSKICVGTDRKRWRSSVAVTHTGGNI
jgi:hypothetical protein